jgi:MarR family transcriptional regulator, lower aerobic nicotinate degradation pathway regulator
VTGTAARLAEAPEYRLDEQVGFVLRQVQQRHALIFASAFGDDLTPMQWAALAKLAERGECSQNLLGRLVSMDVATVKGVVDRLAKRGLAETGADPDDRRRVVVRLTEAGRRLYKASEGRATRVTEETLQPLTEGEREQLLGLLRRLR